MLMLNPKRLQDIYKLEVIKWQVNEKFIKRKKNKYEIWE